jgi:hypothetical protein
MNSNGVIDSSNFTNNYCNSNGGAIGILNLNKNMTIRNTHLTHNKAGLGNGGGLALFTD